MIPPIRCALEDWRANRAYIDGNGNYHVRRARVYAGIRSGEGESFGWGEFMLQPFQEAA